MDHILEAFSVAKKKCAYERKYKHKQTNKTPPQNKAKLTLQLNFMHYKLSAWTLFLKHVQLSV